mmetsp:Transcript_78504/g.199723  ORF Transcript_78504/g.199723 Transcript_78504/m.199723 type:complete len:259 (+) Transcript_78504:1155-1931(+)
MTKSYAMMKSYAIDDVAAIGAVAGVRPQHPRLCQMVTTNCRMSRPHLQVVQISVPEQQHQPHDGDELLQNVHLVRATPPDDVQRTSRHLVFINRIFVGVKHGTEEFSRCDLRQKTDFDGYVVNRPLLACFENLMPWWRFETPGVEQPLIVEGERRIHGFWRIEAALDVVEPRLGGEAHPRRQRMPTRVFHFGRPCQASEQNTCSQRELPQALAEVIKRHMLCQVLAVLRRVLPRIPLHEGRDAERLVVEKDFQRERRQ